MFIGGNEENGKLAESVAEAGGATALEIWHTVLYVSLAARLRAGRSAVLNIGLITGLRAGRSVMLNIGLTRGVNDVLAGLNDALARLNSALSALVKDALSAMLKVALLTRLLRSLTIVWQEMLHFVLARVHDQVGRWGSLIWMSGKWDKDVKKETRME